jgi:hypothetical protein
VDTGQRPQNFIRDVGLADRFEEYPKLRELIKLKVGFTNVFLFINIYFYFNITRQNEHNTSVIIRVRFVQLFSDCRVEIDR